MPAMSDHHHSIPLVEIVLYSIAGISSLFVLGYSIHMFIGGLVSAETERYAIGTALVIGTGTIAYMAQDVLKHRRKD